MITQITINSLIIGTYASGYLFKQLSGFGFPEIRIDVKDRGNYDGAKLGNYNYGRRIMSIDGEIIGSDADDYETKRQALERAVRIGNGLSTMEIETRGGLSLQADVILNALIDVPYKAGNVVRGDFRMEFVAPYPFIVGQTENTDELSVYSGGGGTLPATLPFSLGVGGSGAEVIVNAGNGKAYPTFKIYGAISNPAISNDDTGESLSIAYTLSTSTDYIEVDIFNRTVLLNGVTNILQYVSGDWLTLEAGNNTIKLTASSNSAGAKLEITWRDHYLGI